MANRPYGSPTDFNLLKLALQEKDANESVPGRVPSGIAENAYFNSIPNTAEQQRESNDYAAIDDAANDRYTAQQEANTMGYGSPGAAREDEFHKKMTLAGEPARIAGAANVKAAGTRAEGELSAIQRMFDLRRQEMEDGGGAPLGSMSISGVGSMGATPKPPVQHGPAASVLNGVRAARDAMSGAEPNGLMKMFGKTNPKKAGYDQAVANALGSYDAAARSYGQKLVAQHGNKSASELFEAAKSESQMTPEEENQLYGVLGLLTGQY